MKKTCLLILMSLSLLFISCASLPKYDDNGFAYAESETSNDIIIHHKTAKLENIRDQTAYFYIYGDKLKFFGRYTSSDWLFTSRVVYMDNHNKDNKLILSVSKDKSSVKAYNTYVAIFETVSAQVSDSAQDILNFFRSSDDISMYFLGSKYRSSIYHINDDIQEGYAKTLEKYLEITSN